MGVVAVQILIATPIVNALGVPHLHVSNLQKL